MSGQFALSMAGLAGQRQMIIGRRFAPRTSENESVCRTDARQEQLAASAGRVSPSVSGRSAAGLLLVRGLPRMRHKDIKD
ncbi:MAG TPA: hypothetical protein VGN42_27345, partial [Pirellulales bacterium]|nr:hypothetical protein [Pirellulales bacterium]